jgi:quercetin dioxygenase-like cupin family protein
MDKQVDYIEENTMPLATLADAPTIAHEGLVARPLAVPSRGSTELAIWKLELSPGLAGEPHTVDREEVFVLQQGSLSATVGDDKHELVPGDALIVPPGVMFNLANNGEENAVVTVCSSAGVTASLNGVTIAPPWAQ